MGQTLLLNLAQFSAKGGCVRCWTDDTKIGCESNLEQIRRATWITTLTFSRLKANEVRT